MLLLRLLVLLALHGAAACLGRSRASAGVFSNSCASQRDLRHRALLPSMILSGCPYTELPLGPEEGGNTIINDAHAARSSLRSRGAAKVCYIFPLLLHLPSFYLFQHHGFVWSSAHQGRRRGSSTTFVPEFGQARLLRCPSVSFSSSESWSARFATSRGGATTKNNRDSRPKYLGVKKFGGERVFPGEILVRQRGTRFKAGEGVIRGSDDTLMAVTAGFVSMRRVQRTDSNNSARIKGGHVVSVYPTQEDTVDPKRAKVSLLRALARSWMKQQPK